MTQFDGSSAGSTPAAYAEAAANNGVAPAPEAVPFASSIEDDTNPLSMLDMLRQRVEERERAEVDLWEYTIAPIGVKLFCDPRIDNADYQKWIKASMPRLKGRRAGQPNSMDLDQFQLSSRAMVHTNVRIALRDEKVRDEKAEGAWRPITDSSGEALTVEDKAVLQAFNVMDPIALMKKLFGRDSAAIDAGQDLLRAAGYLDGDEDDDPLV